MAEDKVRNEAEEIEEVAEVQEASAKVSKAEKRKGEKKENFFVRFWKKIKKLCRDIVGEMKKVVWLSKAETKKSSILVIVTVLAIAAAIGVVDTVFSTIINFIAGLIG